MADIVNLRQARKAKARAEKERSAAENRVRFGRTKVERERIEAEDRLRRQGLEAHRLEGGDKDA